MDDIQIGRLYQHIKFKDYYIYTFESGRRSDVGDIIKSIKIIDDPHWPGKDKTEIRDFTIHTLLKNFQLVNDE